MSEAVDQTGPGYVHVHILHVYIHTRTSGSWRSPRPASWRQQSSGSGVCAVHILNTGFSACMSIGGCTVLQTQKKRAR
jgi:hypothetical protein